jgi:hypothetical protein
MRLPDAVHLIGDVHQRASIGSMFVSKLSTIALDVGWFSVGVGGLLAGVQIVGILRGNRTATDRRSA